MKLGIVTDAQVTHHRGQLVASSAMLSQVAGFCPYYDEVLIFSPLPARFDIEDPRLYREEQRNIRIVEIPACPNRRAHSFMLNWPRIRRALQAVLPQADLVNVRIPGMIPMLGRNLCRKLGIPYYVTIHGDMADHLRIKSAQGGWWRKLAYASWLGDVWMNAIARDSVVFSTTPDMRERLRPVARKARSTFSTLLRDQDIVQAPKQLDRSRPIRLLHVGLLELYKAVDYALEAMGMLAERGVDFEYHLVGEGSLRASLERYAHQHGLTDRVFFHGYVPFGPQLWERYDQADIFVFPSLAEGNPKVVLEAMARGLPLVTTPVGGNLEHVQDGIHGRLVKMRDSADIADAVQFVTANQERFQAMSAACLAKARTMTLSESCRQLVEKLREEGLYLADGNRGLASN